MANDASEAPLAFDADEVRHLAALARLGMSDDEVEKFRSELASILGHVHVLAAVDTAGVAPTANGADLLNVAAEDEARPSRSPDEILANAPAREEDYFRVRAVLD